MDKTAALRRLAALVARRSALDAEIDGVVSLLRSPAMDATCEATWQEVGDALGVTKQAAQKAYRHLSWAGGQ